MKSRLLAVVIAAVAGVALGAGATGAQEPATPVPPAATPAALHFSEATISIWPEFDQPSGLVFLAATLAPDVSLPATVTLTIPLEASDPTAVATGNPPQDTTWSKVAAPGGTGITFQTTDRFLELDFYLPMDMTTSNRTVSYTWPADIAADKLTIEVQEPAGATAVTGDPPLPPGVTGDFGLQYHRREVGAAPAGTPIKTTVNYTKLDSVTTFDALGLQKPQPAAASSDSGGGPGTTTLILIVLVGVVIAAGIVWYFVRRSAGATGGRAAASPRVAQPQAPADEVPAAVPQNGAGTGFCTQCGEPAERADRFCSHCGARLRRGASV